MNKKKKLKSILLAVLNAAVAWLLFHSAAVSLFETVFPPPDSAFSHWKGTWVMEDIENQAYGQLVIKNVVPRTNTFEYDLEYEFQDYAEEDDEFTSSYRDQISSEVDDRFNHLEAVNIKRDTVQITTYYDNEGNRGEKRSITTFSMSPDHTYINLMVDTCPTFSSMFGSDGCEPFPYEGQYVKVATDPRCSELKNEHLGAEFGEEHVYTGTIKENMPVKIVLSCDFETLTISGAVTQVINVHAIPELLAVMGGTLADLSGGTGVIDVATDYNFDGYNDLSSIVLDGLGYGAVDTYAIFLYDPAAKEFRYNTELSALSNIGVNEKTKEVTETFCEMKTDLDEIPCHRSVYTWKGGKLVKVRGLTDEDIW